MIFVEKPINDKFEAMEYLVHKAEENGLVTEVNSLLDAVKEREALVSTNLGFNIAIPHGKSDVVNEPFISYLSAKDLFEWDEDEVGEVKYVFLIGVPETGGGQTHLKYISQVSKKLIDEDFRSDLFACKTDDAAYGLLQSINEEV